MSESGEHIVSLDQGAGLLEAHSQMAGQAKTEDRLRLVRQKWERMESTLQQRP
jgi:hypothetical protein